VNTLQVLANGDAVRDVPGGQSQSFTLKLPESNQNIYSNGVAPTPQAQVTFAAKDLKTGMLSDEKSMTLTATTATYVTFDLEDFPATSPTVARFTFSPTNAAINRDVIFNAASSTSSNGTFVGLRRADRHDGHAPQQRAAMFTVVLTVTSDAARRLPRREPSTCRRRCRQQ
jgi:hypothetical protein